jgi:predicted permease
MLTDLAYRLRALFSRKAVEQELDDELRFHLEKLSEKHMAAGLPAEEAARRARLELGGVAQVKEECRDARGVRLVEELGVDLRYGLRQLRKNPGFTTIALLTLALGIGVNTALFSVVNGVLLSPLPYRDPEQLVTLHMSKPSSEHGSISFPNFRDWRNDNTTFAAMAIHRTGTRTLVGADAAESVEVLFVSSDFFAVLGVEPVLGRGFAAGEDELGAAPIAMIDERLWRRKYGGSPDALGQTILLATRAFTLVGVVPSGFDLFQGRAARDLYVPLGQLGATDALRNRQAGMGLHGIARLKPGVSIEQARADMTRVANRLAERYPDANQGTGAKIVPFKQEIVGDVRPLLFILLGAVGFVLLIACVNVANLLLARANGRTRELAIRRALGASRPRLLRQLLTENVLLAMAGGALGLAVAGWATPAALAFLPDGSLPRIDEISLDGRVLAFSLGVSLLSGLLFGLAPALRASDTNVQGALKDGGRGAVGGRHRGQDLLVVVQMAMVLVLLVGAGLMARTLSRLWSADPGLDPEGVTIINLSVPPSIRLSGAPAVRVHLDEVEARVKALPGVDAFSFFRGAFPLVTDWDRWFWRDGRPRPASTRGMGAAIWSAVGPDHLRALRVPLLAGRFFGPGDSFGGQPVVVVDEVFARQHFGSEDPLDKWIHLWDDSRPAQLARIVGIVGHVKQQGLVADHTAPIRAQLYSAIMQQDDFWMTNSSYIGVVVRSRAGMRVGIDTIRTALRELHPELVVSGAQTMDEVIAGSLARHRFALLILGAFAGLALLLASVGIYGVVSYAVGERTAEIGIRMVLGARRGDVLRMILGRGAAMAIAGIAIGVAAALGLTRLMGHLLYGVSATDPVTFAAVATGLTAVALAACYLPARRATRVDPIIALRQE